MRKILIVGLFILSTHSVFAVESDFSAYISCFRSMRDAISFDDYMKQTAYHLGESTSDFSPPSGPVKKWDNTTELDWSDQVVAKKDTGSYSVKETGEVWNAIKVDMLGAPAAPKDQRLSKAQQENKRVQREKLFGKDPKYLDHDKKANLLLISGDLNGSGGLYIVTEKAATFSKFKPERTVTTREFEPAYIKFQRDNPSQGYFLKPTEVYVYIEKPIYRLEGKNYSLHPSIYSIDGPPVAPGYMEVSIERKTPVELKPLEITVDQAKLALRGAITKRMSMVPKGKKFDYASCEKVDDAEVRKQLQGIR